MSDVEKSPATRKIKIKIPGTPEEVLLSRVHGDISSGIRFELTGDESYFNKLPDSEQLRDHINRKGRVFVTESDDYLFIDPES